MKIIAGQGIIFFYCLSVLLVVPVDTAFVTGLLSALIYGTFNIVMAERKWNLLSTVLFLAAAFFCPAFLLFAPFVLYSILEQKNYLLGIVLGIMCAWFYMETEPKAGILIFVGCVISWFIQHQTYRYEELDKTYRRTRDDSTERNLLLKEKNQGLLKNQDYEIYTATLRERNRIAREIHDNVGHMLSRAILMVGAMKAVQKEDTLAEALDQLEETLNTAMNNVRESVHDLHDDSVNLEEVLRTLAKEYTFCLVNLEFDMGYHVPREVKYSFISIVKEALNNVAKHSDADAVRIVAREHPGLYQLVIEDNGTKGAIKTAGNMPGVSEGIGIQNMRERIRTLGGTIQIRNEKGVRIYITVPKKEEAA